MLAVWCLALLLWGGCHHNTVQNPPEVSSPQDPELSWQDITDGISYDTIAVKISSKQEKDLILVKIDPTKARFHIYENTDYDNAKTLAEIHKETKALITFNGGFYSEEFKPTGLLLIEGKTITPYKQANLINGIFAIDKENQPILLTHSKLTDPENYLFAIQNGPILLNEKGEVAITQDNAKPASRTAIGIDKDGNIVVIVLKQSLFKSNNHILLTDFAHLLKENPALNPLGLHSVLNLDGGPSSGIMIQDNYFAEFQKIQNAIWIEKK